jgi:hypothetical protein
MKKAPGALVITHQKRVKQYVLPSPLLLSSFLPSPCLLPGPLLSLPCPSLPPPCPPLLPPPVLSASLSSFSPFVFSESGKSRNYSVSVVLHLKKPKIQNSFFYFP